MTTYVNDRGLFHRLDGYQAWWVNGAQHRLDGPAVISRSGDQEWWVNDNDITEGVIAWMNGNNIPKNYMDWTNVHRVLFRLMF